MGSKKGYNWKARQVTSTIIDDSATKNITINLDGCKEHYDQSNLLVLPSKKRKTKIKETITKITKILSKKQRKRLEKIVDKKKKKENRSNLLDSLSKVQATPEELKKLTSIASIQTKGLKKLFQEELNPNKRKAKADQAVLSGDVQLNSLSGSKRRKVIEDDGVKTEVNKDPNVVGFESDSESDEDSHTSEEIKEEIIDQNKPKIEHTDNAEIVVTNNLVDNHQKQKPRNTVLPAQDNSKMIVNKKIVNVEKNKKLLKKDKDCQIIEPQKEELHLIKKKTAVFVDVLRDKNIQKARLKLPILAEEQQIMEIINENSVIILAGETGSGKTTQVPQFLYEAGYALKKQIAVTQPRRVAAISMSKRVAEEMNLSSREVSYLIRFEGNATDETKIKFMTDGVLLKEVQTDFLLSKYSVVILDEAHERSVYTDILIGLLSRIVPLRHKRKDPLKLIIMSATLRLEDFTTNERLFKIPPPTIKVDARQFPVTIHFNKRTNENYLKEALNKVVKIHTKLPEGGILVFLTGQQEVNSLVKKLRTIFPLKNKSSLQDSTHKNRVKNANDHTKTSESSSDEENEKNYVGLKKPLKTKKKVVLPEIDLDDYSVPDDTDLHSENGSIIPSDDDSDDEIGVISNAQPMWVLPLYSLLPTDKQARIFEATPAGYRLCVVSTNVAETSLTIPNVKYVVDSGKTKVKLYDKVTGVTSYMVSWTSKASANQRAGRAGRIGPGHCYRLYSSAIFNDEFTEYSEPEIQQKPVDDLFLQMKCMNIDKIINFPFPTAPNLLQLKTAEERLNIVGALKDGSVTPLGRAIAKFPVLPRYGKMLALSHQQNLLPYTVCLVAALSVQEVLLEVPTVAVSEDDLKNVRQKWAATRLQWAGHGNSLLLGDAIVLLKAVGAAEYAHSQGKIEKFCNDNGLRAKAVIEIRKLRHQLSNEIKMNLPEAEVIVDPKLTPPSDLQAKLLRQILLSGMGDQIAKKVYPDEIEDKEHKSKYKFAYHANNMKDYVHLHQGSVLKKTLPEFVIYQEIYETNKMYMRGVTAIEPEWLPVYVPSLCNLSEPLYDPKPTFQNGKVYCTVNGTFGNQAWTLPNIQMEFPKNIDCYKWFARFLLEGRVFSKFSKYTGVLLSQPNIMVKSWAKLHVRTDALLKALVARQCCDKESLEEAWHQNKNYLLDEYLKWLPESTHGEITLMWPPLN